MYSIMLLRCKCATDVLSRCLSTAEISTALRPFYFSVHPDLFGKYPEQRKINEYSLQQLSSLLESQQSSRSMTLPPLHFYLRQKNMQEGDFKHVKIHLTGSDVRDTVVKVLSSCELSTKYVDKIPKSSSYRSEKRSRMSQEDFRNAYQEFGSEFEKMASVKSEIKEKKSIETLIEWVSENSELAKKQYELTKATRDQVKTLVELLRSTYGIKDVKWDSGWNISHIRGALQSLVSLASQHASDMGNIKGRTIALGQFTGVSLDGDVYLNIIDVRNEWLSLIKKVSIEENALTAIPHYEETLSTILRGIRIARRKFMPKVSATQYCSHLRQLVTSLGDFQGCGKKFPESLPETLAKYQIVVEPEAGPLMLSPTGQFITPSSCPADHLIYYIAKNIEDATLLLTEYNINKHVEKALCKEVKDRFGLLALQKDDSVTPTLMIECCERLLMRIGQINAKLEGNILNVTHYYSVLTEGVLCIPWNFK